MADTRKARLTVEQARRVGRVVAQVESELGAAAGEKGRGGTRRTPHAMFAVLCTIDGGDAGVFGVSSCTWTYTVESLSGLHEFGTGLTPQRRRFPLVVYTSTPANTVGQGYFDTDGSFVLFDANELPGQDPC